MDALLFQTSLLYMGFSPPLNIIFLVHLIVIYFILLFHLICNIAVAIGLHPRNVPLSVFVVSY